MVWRTNFDRCLASCAAAVVVAGEADPPTQKAVRQKLAQLRGPQMTAAAAGPAAGRPASAGVQCSGGGGGNAACGPASKPGARSISLADCGEQQAGGHIKAGRPEPTTVAQQEPLCGSRGSNALQDGSHAVYESLSLNAADLPEGLAGTLQHIVGQLDMLTQVQCGLKGEGTWQGYTALRNSRVLWGNVTSGSLW